MGGFSSIPWHDPDMMSYGLRNQHNSWFISFGFISNVRTTWVYIWYVDSIHEILDFGYKTIYLTLNISDIKRCMGLYLKTFMVFIHEISCCWMISLMNTTDFIVPMLGATCIQKKTRRVSISIYMISNWWFQPPWKILVRLDNHPNYWGK